MSYIQTLTAMDPLKILALRDSPKMVTVGGRWLCSCGRHYAISMPEQFPGEGTHMPWPDYTIHQN